MFCSGRQLIRGFKLGSMEDKELRLHSPVGAEPVVYSWSLLTSGRGSVSWASISMLAFFGVSLLYTLTQPSLGL